MLAAAGPRARAAVFVAGGGGRGLETALLRGHEDWDEDLVRHFR